MTVGEHKIIYTKKGWSIMYALYNIKTKKFFRRENEYRNLCEVDTFIEAKTFKTKKDAEYMNCLIKGEYKVVNIEEVTEMNKLM